MRLLSGPRIRPEPGLSSILPVISHAGTVLSELLLHRPLGGHRGTPGPGADTDMVLVVLHRDDGFRVGSQCSWQLPC